MGAAYKLESKWKKATSTLVAAALSDIARAQGNAKSVPV